METKWYKPSQRPPYAPDAPEISINVLLYCPKDKMHAIGWFNFDIEKWNTFEEFYLEQEWIWTFLPVPNEG